MKGLRRERDLIGRRGRTKNVYGSTFIYGSCSKWEDPAFFSFLFFPFWAIYFSYFRKVDFMFLRFFFLCLVCLWSCFRLSWIFVSEIFEALIYGLQCMRYRERVLSSFIFWIESHQTSTILSTLLSSVSLNCYLICLLLRSVWFLQIFSRSCFIMIGAAECFYDQWK